MNVYVIDANTVVSAALTPNGVPRRAISFARATGTIALSETVYSEIIAVLSRPKFARVLSADRLDEIVELLSAAAIWREPRERVLDCRDLKDNRYLELAIAAEATAILSGDDDLLVLNPWRGIPVLRPSDFLLRFEAARR